MAQEVSDYDQRLTKPASLDELLPSLLSDVVERVEDRYELYVAFEGQFVDCSHRLFVLDVLHSLRKVVAAESEEVDVAVRIARHLLS